ncbi:peptidylprolyl isomerase [Hymenobacter busanensis]|uniref:Periplasmic chaperone PpiD n=1 Tax=Hymenobacter busanensis TaxID=2607656 RepID=A0A7L5A058_9BACT|nr:peptidylprolyl isomerase [Hymenobacter busanensis]KAA9332931.1 peptidylprolyl isomerase [Hymenobacter busanensis]QHJ08395.1 peptidylprolyl isomerase [Hymenobacter busanensis]
MALINTIREKSGWAVGTVAVGMLLFIVGGDLIGGQNRLFNRQDTTVGSVNGDDVNLDEFNAILEQSKEAYVSQNGRQPTEQELQGLRDQAWNQIVFRRAFQPEFDKLGLQVTDDELTDMVQGRNIHPTIKQAFTDPKTGQFDRAKVLEYLRNLDKMPPQQQAAWYTFEQNLPQERMGNKYYALMKNSEYVTTAEAQRYAEAQAAKANIRYLFVPYFSISDSAVKVSDAQLQDYISRNKARYKVQDGRDLEYVVIPVTASKEDSASVRQTVNELAQQFQTAPNDSLFVRAQSDQPYNGTFVSPADLPEKLRQQLPLEQGKVYGPFAENGTFSLYKVTGAKAGTTSAARASHILIKADGATPEADAAAKAKAQGILNQIKGGADFATLARQYGTDGTAPLGGDLGWFTSGRMVPEFEKAVFGATSAGLLPTLTKTSFGYHIIKVTAPKTNQTYRVATVTKSITPSDATNDVAYQRAQELKGKASDLEAFRKAVAADKTLQKQEAKGVGKSDQNVGNVPNAREIIRWAYDKKTEVGGVSDVFTIGDQYVIAAVTGTREKGTADVASVKPEVSTFVRNEEKAKQIIAKLKGSSLEQMASAYGSTAQVRTANDVALGQGVIPGLGAEPVAVGTVFGLKPGQRSAPIQGEQGVLVVELVNTTPAPAGQDLKTARTQLQGMRSSRATGAIYEAVREKADVKDERVRFF